jgi:DNA polymerase-1
MIVGEAPGEQEALKGEPFVGASGQELNNMLRDGGVMRSACFITNVCRVRPPNNEIEAFIAARKTDITEAHIRIRDRWCLPVIRDGIEMLKREIALCRPNVIFAFGNISMWALTGQWGITSWRGSVLECDLDLGLDYRPKVIPMYHPAAILRQWTWRNIAVHDIKRGKVQSKFREIIRPEYRFVVRPDFGTVCSILHQLIAEADKRDGQNFRLANDIETRAGHISCIGIAWSKTEALCIPLMDLGKPEGYWSFEEELEIWRLLRILCTHKNVYWIGQNFSYDQQYYNRWALFEVNLAWDTMLGQHSMFSNVQKGLDFLSSMYCDHHEYWKDEGKKFDPKKHDEERHWVYNCKDAVITYEVEEGEQKAIRALTQAGWPKLPAVVDFQQRLFWPVQETMQRGLRVDTAERQRFAMKLMDEIAKREQWMFDMLGEPVNIKSPLQMKRLFYEVLGQKPIFSRKTGGITTDDEALRKIADREPLLRPLCKRIAELRSLGVFLSTFINAPLDHDGRMRSSFNIGGTETYRFSSSENAFGSGLNLQNIPKGGEDSEGLDLPNVRNLFIPDTGYTFFDIDLSSADLRIVVWESDEPEMKAMLREGLDPYTEIAKEFYHDPTITKKDPRRQTFKSFAHGTNYLGTAKGLAERLGLPVAEAEKTQAWYFQRFPRIKKWQDDLKDQVFKRRMVENIFGYRCYIFDRIEGTIFNQAAAWIPQSTVGCLINRAYDTIFREHKDVQVLLQVHDSLAGQFPTKDMESCVSRILKAAEVVLPYSDPLIIPVGIKTSTKSWGDCE